MSDAATKQPEVRVAMLVPNYPPEFGGAGGQAERLARALRAERTAVTILTRRLRGSTAPARERDGTLEIRRFRTPRTDQRLLVLGLRAALWLLLHRDWDVLHVHGLYYYGVLPALAARLLRRPVLAKTTLVDARLAVDAPVSARVAWRVYRGCEAVVALSSALEQSLQDDGQFRGAILRIPNGVDTCLFHPPNTDERRAARTALELPADTVVIASAGRLERRKQVVGLVEAAACMRHRPLCVVLAGPDSPDPQDRESLERAIAALPEGVEVRLLGAVGTATLVELLRAADIFALPSESEGMPNSLLEAMASGLACVAADVPGSADALSGAGLLVPAGQPEELRRALDGLAAEPELRERLGRAALERAREDYGLAAVAARYAETYRALV